jgi:bifunctional non-homologous end joining protein LigD
VHDLEESRISLQRVNAALRNDIHPYTDYHQNPTAALPARAVERGRLRAPTQRAVYVLQPPTGREWVHELNHSGHRLICRRQGDKVSIIDDNSYERNERFPSLVAALLSLNVQHIQLDGVAVVMDEDGLSSSARIDNAVAGGDDSEVRYLAFDLLWLNGADLSHFSLLERKKHLRRVLREGGASSTIRYTGHLRQDGAKMLQQAALLGLDGIISKRADAPYRAGLCLEWQMTKCTPPALTSPA